MKVGWVVSAMRGLVQVAVRAHNKGNPSQWRRSDCLPEFVRCLQFTSVFHLHCYTDPQDSIWDFYLLVRILDNVLCDEFSDLPLYR